MQLALADVFLFIVLVATLATIDCRAVIAAAVAERARIEIRAIFPRTERRVPVFDQAVTPQRFMRRRSLSMPFIVIYVCIVVFCFMRPSCVR